MNRNFYGHQTVTDYLISMGFKFHPQTVIIEIDAKDDDIESNEPPLVVDVRCRPIFDYQTVETIYTTPDGKQASLFYILWHADRLQASIYSFGIMNGVPRVNLYYLTIQYDDTGHVSSGEQGYLWGEIESFHFLHSKGVVMLAQHLSLEFMLAGLSAFARIHEGYEVEEVEFSRQVRRATERKTGKKPSNYYSLRDIKKTRKRYPASNSTGVKLAKAEAHLVRGHFLTHPDSHPLPQFAGKTFWVSSHQRGVGTNGKKVIYRVEL